MSLTDDEREALRVASEVGARRLESLKAAADLAPAPLAAICSSFVGPGAKERKTGSSDGRETAEPLPTRPWWCGNPDCRQPGPWRPYPFCDHCAEVDRRRRLADHVRLAVAAGDRAQMARLYRQACRMGRGDESAQLLEPLLELARADLAKLACTADAELNAPWLAAKVGREAFAKALAYVRAPGWLLLEGPSRAGKTNLSAAIYRALIDQASAEADVTRAIGMRFLPARLLRKAQQEHKLGAGEPALIGEARRATVLVLDDLGNEGPDRGQAVGDVLFDRHEERAPTIVTTGLSREEIATRYGTGLKERLCEGVTAWLGKK